MLHVVFGAGQVGGAVAKGLLEAGHRVRIVRRRDAPVPDGAELCLGDARDPAFVKKASEGAAVIYHCMNPSAYTTKAWESEFPAMGEAMIAAALAHKARLVCLDNLYGYGIQSEKRRENSPMLAEGPKGKVRVAWDARLRGQAGLRFVVGRAGDFFGPGADQALFSPKMLQDLRAGKSVWLVGDPAAVHAFSFVPEVARSLVRLGTAENSVEGQVFHLPVIQLAPAELLAHLAKALGVPAHYHSLPGWVLRMFGPFGGLLGELSETAYQWDRPFLVDDQLFRGRFPGSPTVEEAARQTAAGLA